MSFTIYFPRETHKSITETLNYQYNHCSRNTGNETKCCGTLSFTEGEGRAAGVDKDCILNWTKTHLI